MKDVALVILVAVSVCVSGEEHQTGYSGRLAHIDVNSILNNERILKSFLNCFLDKGPCTPDGREAKKALPEVYFTNCSKCSKDQKKLAKKTFKAFYSKRKADWEDVVMKYDPERKHEKKFLEWTNEP